jgi:hypothetical protein
VADKLADAESDGAALALRALWPLSVGSWYGNPVHETRDLVVTTARRLQRNDSSPMVLSVAACADPVKEAAWVIGKMTKIAPEFMDDPTEQHALGASLTAIWAFDLSWPYLCAAVDGLRRHGRLGLLGEALASQAWAAIHLGKHRLATTAADEASRLSRDTGRRRWALVADLATATLASERGQSGGRYAIVNNQYGDAFEQLARVLDPSDIAYHPFVGYWGIADLIEAAARTGRSDEAKRYLARLDDLAKAMAAYAHPLPPSTTQQSLFTSRPFTPSYPTGRFTEHGSCWLTAGG